MLNIHAKLVFSWNGFAPQNLIAWKLNWNKNSGTKKRQHGIVLWNSIRNQLIVEMYLPVLKLDTQTLFHIRANCSDRNVRIFGTIFEQIFKIRWKNINGNGFWNGRFGCCIWEQFASLFIDCINQRVFGTMLVCVHVFEMSFERYY